MEGLLTLIIFILWIVGMWKAFAKAGEPGWAAIVPLYNLWVLNKIGGKPWWWIILYLIPLANIVFLILLNIAVAKKFGKSAGFGVGMVFLGFIFWPILGFSDDQYRG